jgi:hypothetical protein
MLRRLHVILVTTVLAWWGCTEILNAMIAHQHGQAFIPFSERRDTDELSPFRMTTAVGGPREAMVRSLMAGCLLIPLAYALTLTSLTQAFSPMLRTIDESASSHASRRARPQYGWLLASCLLLLVCVRVFMLSAWEAAVHIMD